MKSLLILPTIFLSGSLWAQNVGIGTTTPSSKLHIKNDYELLRLQGTSSYLTFYDNTETYIGYFWNRNNTSIDIGTASASIPVTISPNLNTVATFHPNGNLGLGVANPGFRLDVSGRIRLRHQGATAGMWLNNSTNTTSPAFVGLASNNEVGFYGDAAGWQLLMNTTTGNVGIGSAPGAAEKLRVESSGTALYTGGFSTSSTAVKLGTGKVVVEGAGVNTATSTFVHKATAANSPGAAGYTVIDNPYCNGNPQAILIVTMNGTYGSGSGPGYNDTPEQFGSSGDAQIVSTTSFMVVYNGPGCSFYAAAPAYARDKWLIRTYTGRSVSSPLNFNFNVMAVNPN